MSSHADAPASTVPRAIHADRPARELRISWSDGHETVYDFTTLRWLCACAFCRGEAGQPGWLDSRPMLSEAQVALTDVSLVGSYAIQPRWADGHSSGYYTFERLREACPCAEDQERRARSSSQAGSRHQHA